MGPQQKQLFHELAWMGNQYIDPLEKKLGFQLASRKTTKTHHYYYGRATTQYTMRQDLFWVAYEEAWTSKGGQIVLGLPPAIRQAFKKVMKKPKGYDPEPFDTLPEELKTFRCDDELAEDFRVTADFIVRGHLQLNKNGTIKKPCIRAVAGMTSGREFFPNEKMSPKLPLLRHEMLITLIGLCETSLREAMLEDPPDPKKLLRSLCNTLFKHPDWFHEIVLSHIKTGGWKAYEQKSEANLKELFSLLLTDQWVDVENLVAISHYRELRINPFSRINCTVNVDRKSPRFDYSPRIEISGINAMALLFIPLIQGTAVLLAALGLAEIAYTLPPEHSEWRRPSEIFLTPYDGVRAVRLTQAGAYALGLRDEIKLKSADRARAEIILNPQRLTATCRHIDPITEMSLLEYMEKISDGCYRMTRQSLMRSCSSKSDVETRVAGFRRHIAKELPPFWDEFFESTVQTVIALKTQTHYKIYELADSPELRRLFMTDSILREKTLKVEGMRIAIHKQEQDAVERRLSSLGYLVQ